MTFPINGEGVKPALSLRDFKWDTTEYIYLTPLAKLRNDWIAAVDGGTVLIEADPGI